MTSCNFIKTQESQLLNEDAPIEVDTAAYCSSEAYNEEDHDDEIRSFACQ